MKVAYVESGFLMLQWISCFYLILHFNDTKPGGHIVSDCLMSDFCPPCMLGFRSWGEN